MKSVLISIKPYWVFLIIAKKIGWNAPQEKTVEVRKTYPKSEDWNGKVLIYCTIDKKSFGQIPEEYRPLMHPLIGKVIGEFVCDSIEDYSEFPYEFDALARHIKLDAIIDYHLIYKYLGGKKCGYGWHISDLKIYDKPMELCNFSAASSVLTFSDDGKKVTFSGMKRPPQSWCYVKEVDIG